MLGEVDDLSLVRSVDLEDHGNAAGALLEVGLDEYSGRSCNNVWIDLLAGERGLLKPTPPERTIPPAPLTIIRSASPD